MRIYRWKKNLNVIHADSSRTTRGKLSVKTPDADWVNTKKPIMVLVSPYSAFHEGTNGDLKMNALIAAIQAHVQTPVCVLIADTSHLETLRLKYADEAVEEAKKTSRKLVDRYRDMLAECNLFYWHSLIHQANIFHG